MRKILCSFVAAAGFLTAGAAWSAPGDVLGAATSVPQASLPSVHGLMPAVDFGASARAAGGSTYRRAPEAGATSPQTAARMPTEEPDGGLMLLAGAVVIGALIAKRISS